jgi:membrane protein YdbS with pleckstrin-like domain
MQPSDAQSGSGEIQPGATLESQPMITPFQAAFNPLIRTYLVVTIGLTMIMTVIGIPLAMFWFLGLGQWWSQHYFERLECELTDKSLRFRKGILVQVEKTIPLENIQDVTFVEGPILRHFNLSTLKFETAGASLGDGANMELTGIIYAQDFRNRILAARDTLKQSSNSASKNHDELATLAALQRIEKVLVDIAAQLKTRN